MAGSVRTGLVDASLRKDGSVGVDRFGFSHTPNWPAPGSEDTELGVEGTREFKLEAVRLIKDRGVSYVQASQDLNVHTSQLRDWVKKFSDGPQHAFPSHGQMKPEQLEIVRLKREVAKLKAERDILKNCRGLLREGIDVKFS